MTIEEYQEKAMRTANHDIESISYRKDSETMIKIDHALIGMVTEIGELADAIKKFEYYGQPLDRENIKEGLGDIMRYWSLAIDSMGFNVQEVLNYNIEKLSKRYPDGFNEKSASERKDKK
jgi:NTP pyrophosphatase (non-canonical NTP hydrolase)